MAAITSYSADSLCFDYKNPRLVEFSITKSTDEKTILNILWNEMAVDEIVLSILAHGFFENEAMLAVEEDGKIIIVEGNRRLAAVKAIISPELIENSGMQKYKKRITSELVDNLATNLPVIRLENRQEAWRYIGFKHVNGAAKWNGFAKAKYIATVHHDFGISLDDIAEQIGDTNKTVIKLYQGLMYLEQAERLNIYDPSDSFNGRIFFSHLYTAVQYDGFQKFLGSKDNEPEKRDPVPPEKLENLKSVMYWLFGSKTLDLKPIIASQNPDLSNLNNVLLNREATEALKVKGDLSIAYDMSLDSASVLYNSLVEAKVALQKASSKIASFKGDTETLKISGSVANIADSIYDNLERAKSEMEGKGSKKRVSE